MSLHRTIFLSAIAAFTLFAQEAVPFRIATFNVRVPVDKSPNDWKARVPRIRTLLEKYRLDVIGVQELTPKQKAALLSPDTPYEAVGVGREPDQGGEQCCIFYRTERFDCLENGTFWLSETPDVVGSRSWNTACRRICTWVRLRDRLTGQIFLHFNTHLDHISEEARQKGAELILSQIEVLGQGLPCFLTGDLNCRADSPAVQAILVKLRDSKSASESPHEGPVQTFHAYRYNPDNPGKNEIDFIFFQGGIRVLRHITISDHDGDEYPSDHFPVMAEVILDIPPSRPRGSDEHL
ncbi:MAG: endonuclease/exonuclease/phosphatase family protein [Victivallales bacterium]|nr:endonuclease/exonuclease/phosphatase family protein [Victivallales bacterium]